MTRLTRKLLLSILTVVLSIGALGTTTFAWFTVTNVASVESFSADIISDSGIELSLDGVNWYNKLSESIVQEFLNTKYGYTMVEDSPVTNFRFDNVTSSNGIQMSDLNGTDVSSGNKHLQLVIFFRSASVEKIAWTGVSLASEPKIWRADASYTNSKGVPVVAGTNQTVYAMDAMRISVFSPVDVALETAPLTPIVFEREASATNTVLGAQTTANLTTANGAINYYFKKTGVYPTGSNLVTVPTTRTSIVQADNLVVLKLNTTGETQTVTYTTAPYFPAAGQEVVYNTEYGGYLVINIWVEGFDAEAFNSILSGQISTSFEFRGFPYPVTP